MESFHSFCENIGGATRDLMCPVLQVQSLSEQEANQLIVTWKYRRTTLDFSFLAPFFTKFEADRRAFIITVNSFGTDLSGDDRSALYPSCGKLAPNGLRLLAKAEDHEQVKAVAECYPVSRIVSLS